MTEIKFSTGGNCEFFCSKKPGDFSLNSEISLKKKKKIKKKKKKKKKTDSSQFPN